MRLMNFLSSALTISLFLPIDFALGADYPTYKDGLLTIPAVNTDEQVGKYQDITFKLTEQGSWQLLDVRTIGTTVGTATGTSSLGLATIEKIDVIKTDTFPTQVFLRASGWLGGSGCSSMGQINQRQVNNRFDITIATNTVFSGGVSCTQLMPYFIKTLPLSIYGLSAGTYSYNVNGTTGTFELTADNKYPGDY